MSLRVGESPQAGLASLPWEVFNEITGYLRHGDILALSFVCRAIRSLARSALHTDVKVRGKTAFVSLSRALASEPHLCDVARTYRVISNAPWWSLDLLDSFRCLQEFVFRPTNLAQEDAVRTVRRIAAGSWIQPTLRRCTIELCCPSFKEVPGEDIAQLLCTVLSAPSLNAVTVTYAHDPTNLYNIQDPATGSSVCPDLVDAPPSTLSTLSGSRRTDLRELHLHCYHLSLPWISALLRLPRNLEVLHLQINKVCYVNRKSSEFTHLNCALRPVADTLRALTLYPKRYRTSISDTTTWLEDLHVEWGPDGFREFGKLEFIGLPQKSWTPWRYLPVYGGQVLLPESLRTLHIIGAKLVRSRPRNWRPLSEDDPSGMESLAVDRHLLGMHDVDRLVEGTPRLRYIQITLSGWLDADKIREQMPPLRLPKPLVDHGVKILVQLPEGDKLELETYH